MQATYVSSNQFKVDEDKTEEFLAGRRVRALCGSEYKYSTVYSSVYSSPYTTTTIEETILTSNLTEVHYGIVNIGEQGSFPKHSHDGSEGTGGLLSLLNLSDTPDVYEEGEYLRATTSGVEFAVPDDRYYTESEVDTISGTLQTDIDDKSDTSHLHDARYYTESEVDTISGSLQTNIDDKIVWHLTEGAPATVLGKAGDLALDQLVGTIYEKGAGGGDTSTTFYVGDTTDDGRFRVSYYNNSLNYSTFGNYYSQYWNGFFRFPNISVQKDSTIINAFVRFTAPSNNAGTCHLNIYFNKVDNAVAPSNETEAFALVLTNPTAWNNVPDWTVAGTYDTVDLSTVLQEIVNRPGWSSGNAVQIIVNDNGGTSGVVRDCNTFGHASGGGVELHITYSSIALWEEKLSPDLLKLSDTPTTYSGVSGKYLKTTTSGIEFSDDELYTKSEVDTVSGSLQTNIDGKSDTGHTHDDRYYTESEVDTISGTLQTSIDTIPNTLIGLNDTPDSYPTVSGSDFPLDYSKRIKLTIDNTNVDGTLSNFPVLVKLSNSSGITSANVTSVFTELGSDANRKKIAVTTSDEETQCYVEIERFDYSNSVAWLWVKVPSVAFGATTDLYFYYDSTQSDNTTYIGDIGDTPAQNVWDSNFKLVMHIAQDPNGDVADAIKDSTSNANHGTPGGSMTSADLVDGKIGKAIDFDGSNDEIDLGQDVFSGLQGTIECIIKFNNLDQVQSFFSASDTSESNNYLKAEVLNTDGKFRFQHTSSNVVKGNTVLSSGVLYYIGITSNGTVWTLDVNDISQNLSVIGSNTGDWFDDLPAGTYDNWIGRWERSTSSRTFNGVIDEVRISNTARSAAWIKATYYSSWDGLVSFGSEETGVGEVLRYITVNAENDGVEFTIFPTIPETFLDLSDTSTTYSGSSGKYLKTTTSGIDFVEDLYTKTEVDTISGSLNTKIDGKSDTGHTHDDRYYTESEVDTISGTLQTSINSMPTTVLELSDTPTTYSGAAGKYVKTTSSGIEFSDDYHFGDDTNYTQIETDGKIHFFGGAQPVNFTVIDSLMCDASHLAPLSMTSLAASNGILTSDLDTSAGSSRRIEVIGVDGGIYVKGRNKGAYTQGDTTHESYRVKIKLNTTNAVWEQSGEWKIILDILSGDITGDFTVYMPPFSIMEYDSLEVYVTVDGATYAEITSRGFDVSVSGPVAAEELFSNNETTGSGIVVEVASTAGFYVGNEVFVSDSSNSEWVRIEEVVEDTSITVDLSNSYTTVSGAKFNIFDYVKTTLTEPIQRGLFRTKIFKASENSGIQFQMPVPQQTDPTKDLGVVLQYVSTADNPGSSLVSKWRVQYFFKTLGEDIPESYQYAELVYADVTPPVTKCNYIATLATITPEAHQGKNLLAMQVTRLGADSGDTYTGNFKLAAVVVNMPWKQLGYEA